MGSNFEKVEVKFCDICGEKETLHHSMHLCWKCGKDCCDRHIHLVTVEGVERMHTYLCDPDRAEFHDKVKSLFQDFSLDRGRREA